MHRYLLAILMIVLSPAVAESKLLLRVFKVPGTVEMWRSGPDRVYTLVQTYPICAISGTVGPKMREGDRQTPEGFYRLTPKSMNYNSHSINTGYPSAYDRSRGWTGSYIMIHGGCSSIGCIAIGDAINDVFTAVKLETARSDVTLQIFPFRLTEENVARAKELSSPFYMFWLEHLQPAYISFERTHKLE